MTPDVAPRRLTFDARSLVVVAALSGSGKTTLLERLVPVASQRRHAARWRLLRRDAAHGGVPREAWTSVRLPDRAGADAVGAVSIEPRRASRLLRAHVAG